MMDSFEDDTHYCIKCHVTIIGLQNYVNHRKSKCGKQTDLSKKSNSSTELLNEKPLNLEADDFFSSLELQSSAKKSNTTHSPGGKSFSGILTRSKANAVLQASNPTKESPELNNSKNDGAEWISEADLNKTPTRKEIALPQHYGEIEEDSDEYEYDDGEFSEDEEEDNLDVPPRSFTGGKWKPTSSPIQWQRSQDDNYWNVPQPHHTGGKWKPQAFLQSKAEETYDVPPPSFTGSKWTLSKVLTSENKIKPKVSIFTSSNDKWNDVPPPEHTKGKWKPQSFFSQEEVPPGSYTKGKWKPSEDGPPSSYTQGKWKPEKPQALQNDKAEVSPLCKSSGTVQYWCRPCDRRLASKIVYERHLKSELHYRRTLNDSEFDDSPYLNTNFVANKRKLSKSPEYISTLLVKSANVVSDTKTQGRSRKKIFITCEGCDSKVNYQLIGKHLISHYHCRKTDMNLLKSQLMVLENIHSIILQSPYQCSPCKFYCNTHEWFLQHWLSESHNAIVLAPESFFWCCVCKFRAKNSKAMYDHLSSDEHHGINLAINRSVPVIIKKLTPIKCPTCDVEFKLNIELRKHCEKENHSHSLTSSDTYQNKCECSQCSVILKSRRALQRHQMFNHNAETYICSVCSLNFNSKLEAKKHRNTPEHRCAVIEKNQKDASKTCQYCKAVMKNIVELREHLTENHPDEVHSCSKCGKKFVIPQDLAVHIRKKACEFENVLDSKSNSCDQCQFSTDSTSELLFHKVLHAEPVMVYPDDKNEDGRKYPIAHYKCPICEKFYPKLSLRCHLRMHTNERPFVCTICNAGFVRKNNLILHMKNHERKGNSPLPVTSSKEEGERLYLCSTCGASFKKKSILQQHMTRHTGKLYNCVESDCLFSARSRSELKAHMITHSDGTPFNCQLCEYRGKSKQHLKRHMTIHNREKSYQCTQCSFTTRLSSHLKRHQRLHTGAKPFSCPHCEYSCNNLENLRKHVMLTNKHPGKCIYECKFCKEDAFGSNFAKEFKLHLMSKHSDVFLTVKEATKYITQIYQSEEHKDETSIDSLGLDKECTSSKSMDHHEDQILSHIQELTPKLTSSSSAIESTILFTSITNAESSDHIKIHEELFPMLVSSKVGTSSELWNIGGNYDVEESGILIPFHSDRETLLNDHFQ